MFEDIFTYKQTSPEEQMFDSKGNIFFVGSELSAIIWNMQPIIRCTRIDNFNKIATFKWTGSVSKGKTFTHHQLAITKSYWVVV